MVLPLALLICAIVLVLRPHAGSPAASAPTRDPARACAAASTPRAPYLGLAAGKPASGPIATFTSAAGIRPNVIEYYLGFERPFSARQACGITRAGALPLIQWNSDAYPLREVVSGRLDGYLTRYAQAVARFHLPVALSFDHEMNGNWYRWGYHHVAPSLYVAAWRHIHNLFTRAGTRNVIWVWTVNRDSDRSAVSPDRPWWPGSSYVTWIGINGKYATPGSTFGSVFRASLASVRALAAKPVMLTETGIAVGPRRPAQIRNLFTGMAAYPQIIGMAWFNEDATHGNWRLQGDPASDAVFRREARNYR